MTMKPIEFYKMSGSGNDFIIIDNRESVVDEIDLSGFISSVCRRKMSVGADGFILIENTDTADFKWRFFNSDGGTAEMCGNGARCAARFAYLKQIAGQKMSFETLAGLVHANIKKDRVEIKMPDPFDFKTDYFVKLKSGSITVSSINTGVPHVVIETEDIDNANVVKTGREIRFHKEFAPEGTNVNFVCRGNEGIIEIRTYERGVEEETLACGTGSIAAALVMSEKADILSPVKVLTKSGEFLFIYFEKEGNRFYNVYLEGDARVVYEGRLWEDALK